MNQPIHNLILDMDGVLWRGETPLGDLPRFFATLDELGLGYMLATNNATRTRDQYVHKLGQMGVKMPAGRILTSSETTGAYLERHYPQETRIFVVGEIGLWDALRQRNFALIETAEMLPTDKTADLVVVGFTRQTNYTELANAAVLINRGARFIGTNPDKTIPNELGLLPGAGSYLAFFEAATGREPTIIGKPNRFIFEEALRRLDARPEETAMVGDRIETDILGANKVGLQTILLMSGVTGERRLAESEIRPDIVLDDVSALQDYLLQLR